MKPSIRVWWPVLAWALAIALFTLPPPPAPVEGAPAQLDKLVHFGLYLGLGSSLGRALWLSGPVSAAGTILAFAGSLGFAALNEWAQRLSPARDPSIADWLADIAGAALGIAVYLWSRSRSTDAVALANTPATGQGEEM